MEIKEEALTFVKITDDRKWGVITMAPSLNICFH